MPGDGFNYGLMVEEALRGVVRTALRQAAAHGLAGSHHFYISFRTHAPGVEIPEYLRGQYPDEMTIVLQHQFWDLAVDENVFAVTLSFSRVPQRMKIPLDAITAFSDPSVDFGLQFRSAQTAAPATAGAPLVVPPLPPAAEGLSAPEDAAPGTAAPETGGSDAPAERKSGEVVPLDAFRKKQ